MCGIVGYLTSETKVGAINRLKYLSQSIVTNTLRGDDSTGVFVVPSEHEVGDTAGWCKQVCDGYTFTNSNDDFDKMMGGGDETFAAIAHNRAATIGGICVDAAHPFQEGPITLVHNGTLYYTSDLPISQHSIGAINDSHTIAHNFAKHDARDVIPMLSGAFALVWHDSRDNTVNIVRNDDRPLHLASVHGQDTVFIASEAEMLHWILARNKMTIKSLAYPKPGQLLTFQHGSTTPTVEEVELFTSAYYGGYGGYGAAYGGKGTAPAKSWAKEGDGWPAKGVQDPVGKPVPGTTENNIRVGGKKQPVPVLSQELMLEKDLLVEDRYLFSPNYSMVGGTGRLTIVGKIRETGGIGIINGLPEKFVTVDRMTRDWVVRPIAVQNLCNETCAVVCKLVTFHNLNAEIPHKKEESIVEPDIMVPGPGGEWVTEEAFDEATGKGCIQCSGNIYPSDADEVIWVNGERDPMCPQCSAEFYYGGGSIHAH